MALLFDETDDSKSIFDAKYLFTSHWEEAVSLTRRTIRFVEWFIVWRSPRNNAAFVKLSQCSSQRFSLLMGSSQRRKRRKQWSALLLVSLALLVSPYYWWSVLSLKDHENIFLSFSRRQRIGGKLLYTLIDNVPLIITHPTASCSLLRTIFLFDDVTELSLAMGKGSSNEKELVRMNRKLQKNIVEVRSKK